MVRKRVTYMVRTMVFFFAIASLGGYVVQGKTSATLQFPVEQKAEKKGQQSAWRAQVPKMVRVGARKSYTVPITIENTPQSVAGGFFLGETEVTYELWYTVLRWAKTTKGYNFLNSGSAGSEEMGAVPTSKTRIIPVTNVSLFSVFVWLNALSENHTFKPVYCTRENEVLRDAWSLRKNLLSDVYFCKNANGYRLPTVSEWEMAARWIGAQRPLNGKLAQERLHLNGLFWTPPHYASGAMFDADNRLQTMKFAWIYDEKPDAKKSSFFIFSRQSDQNMPKPVKQLQPNVLGLYDMSGNVEEWVLGVEGTKVKNFVGFSRGGSVLDVTVRVVDGERRGQSDQNNFLGFRIAR